MANESGDYRDELVLQREARKLERDQANAEAQSKNFKETFANMLKQEKYRRGLARQALDATKSPNAMPDIMKKAGEGVHRGYHDEEIITGREESLVRMLGEKYQPGEWED